MHTNFEQNRERGLLSRHCRGAGTHGDSGDVGTRLCEENRGLMNYSCVQISLDLGGGQIMLIT